MCIWSNLEHIGEPVKSTDLVLGIINLNMFLITFMTLFLSSPFYLFPQIFMLGKLCYLMKLEALKPCKRWQMIYPRYPILL